MNVLATRAALLTAPVPLSEIESVLEWVDSFKLSRSTKKINRDFSDAVLLAEILFLYYPKLVEMHNYPPRNSAALKLNNWMTLNRKVLKKLKLTLCTETMEQLANSTPGVIERILLMVRDKIRKDEEANKTLNEDQEVSSGGSYYEACGDEENVLVVPVKTRVNGVLELVQQKVVTYNAYIVLKEEIKDAKEAIDVLKQKVQHLDQLMKLKEERIEELQNQLERKAIRRKESDTSQNSNPITPNNSLPVSQKTSEITVYFNGQKKELTANKPKDDIVNASKDIEVKSSKITHNRNEDIFLNKSDSKIDIDDKEKIFTDIQSKEKSITDFKDKVINDIFNPEIKEKFNVSKVVEGVVKSNISQNIEIKSSDEDFKDSMQDLTIEQSVYKEVIEIANLTN